MAEDSIDWIARAGARPKGKRPDFFDDFATDWTLSIVLALMAEVSVLRQQNDTLTRLLEQKSILTRDEIDSYVPDREAAEQRGLETQAYIARVMRGVQQGMEAIGSDDPPIEELSQLFRES